MHPASPEFSVCVRTGMGEGCVGVGCAWSRGSLRGCVCQLSSCECARAAEKLGSGVCTLHRAVLSVHALHVTGCGCTYVCAQASWKIVRACVRLTDCVLLTGCVEFVVLCGGLYASD